jgi:hypothetical protein
MIGKLIWRWFTAVKSSSTPVMLDCPVCSRHNSLAPKRVARLPMPSLNQSYTRSVFVLGIWSNFVGRWGQVWDLIAAVFRGSASLSKPEGSLAKSSI